MNVRNTSSVLGLSLAALLAMVPLAYAHGLALEGTDVVKIETNGEVHAEVKAGASGDASVLRAGAETKLNVHEEDDGRVEIEIESETKGGEKVHETIKVENAQLRADEHALDVLEKVELRLDARTLEKEEAGDIDEADEVKTEVDFKHFIVHKSKEDSRIKSVDVKDSNVEVEYEEPAKLFGFIGTHINARAKADMKGGVEVKYPWYHIFMKKTHSSASLQSQIARAVAAERKGEKEGIASTTMQAEISAAFGIPNLFEIVANTLKNASVKAESETTVAAQ